MAGMLLRLRATRYLDRAERDGRNALKGARAKWAEARGCREQVDLELEGVTRGASSPARGGQRCTDKSRAGSHWEDSRCFI
jgi:hypothetical protein